MWLPFLLITGTLATTSQPLIVGGEIVPITEASFTVQLRSSRNGGSFCGGTVLSSTHILTAAHCVPQQNPVWIVALSQKRTGTGGIGILSKWIRIHPQYKSPQQGAVIKLRAPLPVTVNRLRLQSETVGQWTTSCGWGERNSALSASPTLKCVQLEIVQRDACKKVFPELKPSQLCAGGVQGQNVCYGDSGGPLFVGNSLVGVVSWGRGCARKGHPAIFARMNANTKRWIRRQLFK